MKTLISRLRLRLKQHYCSHVFDLADMGHRPKDNPDGTLDWPCWKCGKVFTEHCGLDVLSHGRSEGKPKGLQDSREGK